jgi:hypothetical protein
MIAKMICSMCSMEMRQSFSTHPSQAVQMLLQKLL